MKRFRLLTMTAVLAAIAGSAATAHDGHPVPAVVAAHDHFHLAADLVVSSPLLLAVLMGGVALGVMLVLQRAARRAAKGGHGRATRRR